MAVIKTQADRIGFHCAETRKANEVVHSFADRWADSCLYETFDFESIDEINPSGLFTRSWQTIGIGRSSNFDMSYLNFKKSITWISKNVINYD